jgi:hypothetical protein
MISNLTNTAVEKQKYSKLYYTVNYKREEVMVFRNVLRGLSDSMNVIKIKI